MRSVRRPRIYHGVGILFLHSSFGLGVWRCLQIDGRKATSLTSFLFIYLLLIAIVRGLAVAGENAMKSKLLLKNIHLADYLPLVR